MSIRICPFCRGPAAARGFASGRGLERILTGSEQSIVTRLTLCAFLLVLMHQAGQVTRCSHVQMRGNSRQGHRGLASEPSRHPRILRVTLAPCPLSLLAFSPATPDPLGQDRFRLGFGCLALQFPGVVLTQFALHLFTRAASVRHEVVFETAWLDWNPDQVLRVAVGILRKQASDGMPRNTPGSLPEV
jgi:hypothetical protein